MSHIRVDLLNTNNKWVGFGLTNVDTFIIRVGFELENVDMIRILTQHEHDPSTRITTPTQNAYWVEKPHNQGPICIFINNIVFRT